MKAIILRTFDTKRNVTTLHTPFHCGMTFHLFSATVYKRIILSIGILGCFLIQNILSAQVLVGPLESNGAKYLEYVEKGAAHRMFPGNSANFYLPDTLSLPVVDDFSTDKFPRHEPWYYSDIRDTVRHALRISPFPDEWPLPYMEEPSFSYILANGQIDSFPNVQYTVILYTDTLNPFLPKDTLTIWAFSGFRIRVNPESQQIDTVSIFPDGTLEGDSIVAMRMFMPNGDGSIWIDNNVYRNNSMGVSPPTIGVATFDGTDFQGRAYSNTIFQNGWADYLTSKPVDLQYPESDSIYLSFWYQPQGRGYAPSSSDSLTVDFFDIERNRWIRVWAIPGRALHPFRPAMVPIRDARFLKKGFRFRFQNFANLAGNVDQWSIDYVKLDRFRNHADTTAEDMAFVEVRTSILRDYQAVPYTQFRQSLVENKWETLISNRHTSPMRVAYRFDLRDEANQLLNQYPTQYTPLPSDTNDVLPFYTDGYADYARFQFPDFNFNFELSGLAPFSDSATFRIVHYLDHFDFDSNSDNDTVVVEQRFHNYWAHDDGTAEKAMWLGNPGSFAMKFTNERTDTLFGVSFYFSPLREINDTRNIFIRVWSSLEPDNLLYEERVRILPFDTDTMAKRIQLNNGFTTYILEEPVPLPAGDFYVGWRQTQVFKANIGFDVNNDASSSSFFRTANNWIMMEEEGAAMIRPMVANRFTIDDLPIQELEQNSRILAFPNPTSGTFSLDVPDGLDIESLSLHDLSGRTVHQWQVANHYETTGLAPGLYILRVFPTNQNAPISMKLLIHSGQ